MKVYCCQFDIAWEDKSANFTTVQQLLAQSPPDPDSLLVLPEMFATGFTMNGQAMAETDSGPTFAFLHDLARHYHVHIVAGLVALDSLTHLPANESVFIDKSGYVLHRYRKIHTMTPAGESAHYRPGSSLPVFPIHSFLAAMTICYDLRFPELYRDATLRNAQLFINIANFPAVRVHHWITLLQARAIENQAYVIAVNRVGSDPHHQYPGRSLIIHPTGRILADAADQPCLISATLSLEQLLAHRSDFPVLHDRRSDGL